MTIASELELLQQTKIDIAAAIEERGIEMPENTPFGEYGSYIRQLGRGDWGILYTTDFPEGKELTEADYNSLGAIDQYDLSFGSVVKETVTGFKFGKNCTTTPRMFLRDCVNLTYLDGLEHVKIYLNNFLMGCTSFNQDITLAIGASIDRNFLRDCSLFNGNIVYLEYVSGSIGSYFLSGCSSFNRPVDLYASFIGDNFLSDCTSFNQVIKVSPKYIGLGFLRGCTSFNQPIVLSVETGFLGDYFLYDCTNFTSTITVSSATPDGNHSLATSNQTAPMFTEGVKIKGQERYTTAWKNALPDSLSSSPYRKLIVTT